MRAILFSFLLFLGLLSISCEKEEIPITLPPADISLRSTQLALGDDYAWRVYYNIEADEVVSMHRKREWDVAFEASSDGDRVQMNSSKYMSLYRSGTSDFDSVIELGVDGPYYDEKGPFLEGAAMADWEAQQEVYIVYRGIDADGVDYGCVKLQIQSVDDTGYTIRHSLLDGNQGQIVFVPKDNSRNLVHYSFDTGIELLEPAKDDWDLLFTQYTRFFDFYLGVPNVHYLVTGVFSNPHLVTVAQPSSTDQTALTDVSEAATFDYSVSEEAIGFDWKLFDLDTGTYSIVDNLYVVHSVNAQFYSVKFNGFYDAVGNKGAPRFDVKLLQ